MRFCTACGSRVDGKNSFCPACGKELTQQAEANVASAGPIPYAGFGIRLVADLIDSIVMIAVFFLTPVLPFNVIFAIVVGSIYGAWMESSSPQASLGKMAFSLKVTDLEGRRISFSRALARWGAKQILKVSVIGCLTFIVIEFSQNKRGIHDLLAGTVVRRTSVAGLLRGSRKADKVD
jgi:uncharacterized RDD family membrane protein YckC